MSSLSQHWPEMAIMADFIGCCSEKSRSRRRRAAREFYGEAGQEMWRGELALGKLAWRCADWIML